MSPVQWEEVVWVAVAAVGLVFAFYNALEARRDLRVVVTSHQNGARLMWARFSRRLHYTFILIEAIFILVGVSAMFRRPSPDATQTSQLLIVVLFVGASVLLTNVSVQWTRVHVAISQALKRKGTPNDRRKND